jgi:hypothetical protein
MELRNKTEQELVQYRFLVGKLDTKMSEGFPALTTKKLAFKTMVN